MLNCSYISLSYPSRDALSERKLLLLRKFGEIAGKVAQFRFEFDHSLQPQFDHTLTLESTSKVYHTPPSSVLALQSRLSREMAEPSTSSTDQTQALPPAPAVPVRRSEPLPGCYTVVWGRNSKDEPNFIKLSPTFGDGDSSRWPDEGPDMTLLGNDHDKQRQWRKTAGELLAKDLGHFDSQFPPLHISLSP